MKSTIGIGIDLGGTKIAGAAFDPNGMVSTKEVVYLEGKTGQQVAKKIKELIQHLLDWAGDHQRQVLRVGATVPGIYYAKSGKVWAPNIPGWDNYPLYEELADFLQDKGIDLAIDSDRAGYILGEVWKGAAQGCRDAIFLAVGTGIGAGILIDNRVLRGTQDIAGAIGWMALTDSYQAKYDRCGCFEYHASGPGMAGLASHSFGRQMTTKELFDAYQTGDERAKEVIHQAIQMWGKATANLVSLFNPEKIIFGGGVFGPAVAFLEDIFQEAKKWAQPISIDLVSFEASKFGSEAGLYGAGYLSIKQPQKPQKPQKQQQQQQQQQHDNFLQL